MQKVDNTWDILRDDYAFSLDPLLNEVGNQRTAIIEFSPYPKIPKARRKMDNRKGTLENGIIAYNEIWILGLICYRS